MSKKLSPSLQGQSQMNTDINTRIATEIMGWRKSPTITIDTEAMRSDGRLHEVYFIQLPSGETVSMNVPDWNPCENIEQAFMVVEKMAGKHMFLNLIDTVTDEHLLSDAKRWFANFSILYDTTEVGVSFADTPAEAICLAALQTLDNK